MVICGDGPGLSALKAAARDHANIRFLGLQPEDRLNELLNLADIHLLPQRKEASDLVMPSKLLGMMASGRPSVIAAPPGSELAAVATEAGLLVPPGDPKAMADAILWLARNPDERMRMGASARAYILQNRSRHAVLSKFEAELKELAASSSPRGSSQESALPQH
jgi:colanic acid biosynthesis glycosyl transferase WcaI